MANAYFKVPPAKNEPVLSYAPGTAERTALQAALADLKSKQIEIGSFIGGQEYLDGDKISMHPPHERNHTLGHFYLGGQDLVHKAIDAAQTAKSDWENMPWEQRAAIFLRAADMIAGPYRAQLSAATMLCQSKNAFQSEIDSIAELADFLRFNVQFLTEIYAQQPESSPTIWNRTEYRPLEGFVFAITPFNFTAIAGNLPAAPAMAGNTVIWKPAESQVYSAGLVMKIFEEAGLPAGVINLVLVDGPKAGEIIFEHPDF
ncbi:MAG: aldehyde dehydrogenase family protein, partial [Bacteroidota bacterium]